MRKPVLVAGIKGYGGLITPENFEMFRRWNFEGRNGGALGELIPKSIIHKDLEFIRRESAAVQTIVSANHALAKRYFDSGPILNKTVQLLKETANYSIAAQVNSEFVRLRPKLVRNCILGESHENELGHIVRENTGHAIASADAATMNMLKHFNGSGSIEEVMTQNECVDPEDIETFLSSLRTLIKIGIIAF